MAGDASDRLEVSRLEDGLHISEVNPLQAIPASKRTREIAGKVFDDIADLLAPEEETLWRAFLESDLSFDGQLYPEEFLLLLKRFLVDGAPQGLEAFLEPGLDDLDCITFSDVARWWAERTALPDAATDALRAALQSHPPTIRWKKLLRQDETELRLAQMTENAVRRTIAVYCVLLYRLKAIRRESAFAEQVAEEAATRAKGQSCHEEGPEEYELQGCFAFYTGDLDTPLPQCHLGDVCGLLGFDVPWSVLRLTQKCYRDPMPYEEFREWWALHSGRGSKWFF